MTALNVAELRLPHRRHEILPANQRDHREWAIEEAVWLFTEYGETSLLDMIRVLQPDVTSEQVLEKVKLLCWLSAQVEDWQLSEHPRAVDAAKQDYEDALHLFAAPVSDFAAETDRALAIVSELPAPPAAPADELAARRGVRA